MQEVTNQKEMKQCPFCAEEILLAAIKCKHCSSSLESPEPEVELTLSDEHPVQVIEEGNLEVRDEPDTSVVSSVKKSAKKHIFVSIYWNLRTKGIVGSIVADVLIKPFLNKALLEQHEDEMQRTRNLMDR